MAQIAGQQREQDAIDHSYRRLLLRVEAFRDAFALHLDNFVAGKPQSIGKWLQSAPEHALFGQHAEPAIGDHRPLQPDELLALFEAAAEESSVSPISLEFLPPVRRPTDGSPADKKNATPLIRFMPATFPISRTAPAARQNTSLHVEPSTATCVVLARESRRPVMASVIK